MKATPLSSGRPGFCLLNLLLFLSTNLLLPGQDWPMWGGSPARNMVSTTKNLPEIWDLKAGKNIKWKAILGSTSYGNPVVADGKVYVGTNNGNPRNPAIRGDKGILMCFRESDGRFLWQAVSDKLASGQENDWPEQGICSSPAVEGKFLYYVTNRGELLCLDTEGFQDKQNNGPFQEELYSSPTDGDVIWKLDMIKELGVFPHNMSNCSPALWGDMVYVETSNGHDESHKRIPSAQAPSFLAVDKRTGKVIWKDNSPGSRILHGQWSSPALGQVGNRVQVFFPGGDGWLYGFNALTGEKLWQFDLNPKEAVWPKTRNDGIATPVYQDGQLFLAIGQDPENGEGVGHSYCIDPAKRGDITGTGRVWHFDKIRRSISTAAVFDGLVYMADFSGFLHCLNQKTGDPYWNYDLLAAVWGSPLVADGKVYLGDEEGEVVLLRAGRELKKIAEINMGSAVYSTPIAANGVLYIMTPSVLYAIATPGAVPLGRRSR
jgi:outer membrane protein assembly factor BamB